MRKFNILHVVRDFSSPTQTFVYDLVCALDAVQKQSSTLIYYGARMLEFERPYERAISIDELAGDVLRRKDKLQLIFKTGNVYKLKAELVMRRFVESSKPDVIHCHFAFVAYQFLFVVYRRYLASFPLVISVHGTDITKQLQLEKHRVRFLQLSKMPRVKIVAASDFVVKILCEYGVRREAIEIVPNAVNPFFWENRKTTPFLADGCFRVINIGRLIPCKGQKYLIEAFAKFVKDTCPSAYLTIVGEGPLESELKQLALSLGVESQIHFAGVLAHEELPGFLARHDLYVHPSVKDEITGQEESFGVAIIEAIAVGLPVVVTNSGGMPFVIGSENRFAHIVEPASVEALLKKLNLVWSEGLAFSDNTEYAAERVNYFSRNNQVQGYLNVYSELVSAR